MGLERALRIRSAWLDSWHSHEIEIEEITDAGDGVIASVHLVGVGKASSVPVDVRLYVIFTLSDGRIKRILECISRTEALEAAGLSE